MRIDLPTHKFKIYCLRNRKTGLNRLKPGLDEDRSKGRASLQFKTAIEMYEAESDEVKAYVAVENRKQKEARLAALKEEPLEVEGKVERVPEAYQRHVCC